MANWQKLINDITWQLKPSPAGVSFHDQEMAARKAIQDAAASGDELALKSAMGSIGGLRRRWASALVFRLTQCVFENRDTSRQKIRQWQRRVFDQSVSSNRLDIYGKLGRAGGGRSDFMEPGAEVDAKAKEIFDRYKRALKEL